MENVGFDPNYVYGTIHTDAYNHLKGTQKGSKTFVADPHNQFHTYTLNWKPDRIEVYFDNSSYFVYTKESNDFGVWPFDTPFNMILNVAIGGDWGGAQGVDRRAFPTTYTIDYVRQYQNGNVVL